MFLIYTYRVFSIWMKRVPPIMVDLLILYTSELLHYSSLSVLHHINFSMIFPRSHLVQFCDPVQTIIVLTSVIWVLQVIHNFLNSYIPRAVIICIFCSFADSWQFWPENGGWGACRLRRLLKLFLCPLPFPLSRKGETNDTLLAKASSSCIISSSSSCIMSFSSNFSIDEQDQFFKHVHLCSIQACGSPFCRQILISKITNHLNENLSETNYFWSNLDRLLSLN